MINKAIILTAGVGTRFLPLSKAVSKELMPLVDKPVIQYLLEEAMEAGVTEAIFVVSPGKKKEIEGYFKKSPKLEKLLKERKQDGLLERVQRIEEISQKINFVFVTQKLPLGDGHAILQARKFIQEPCAIFTNDDIIDSPTPCLSQMIQVFKTSQKPLLALNRLSEDKLPHYGTVDVEKIASRVYKIKKIVEKPKAGEAPSDLAIVGRYIITPEVFEYLKKVEPNQKNEIILADALSAMILDGKMVYGHEIEGRWLECGDILRWLQSTFYFSLKHPEYGNVLRKYLKEIIK
ncbi:MAG: UTP--glucose-1-phosphate uridylyltransferase [Candidatus Nealsonbacteria bacterium]|nr:UTP--glucose-1-phosphate uridylyltransferase [Candidatus Nealsonbacteria bacterium]